MKPEAYDEIEMTNSSFFDNSFNSSRDQLFKSTLGGTKDHRSFRAMLESTRKDINIHNNSNYQSRDYDTSTKLNESRSENSP